VVERAVTEFLSDSPGYQEMRRTILNLVNRQGPLPHSIMLTSARRGEGKSMASACLALTLAKELPSSRVVLVDLDARKATLSPFFGLNGDATERGVSLRLRQLSPENFFPLPLPNLSLLPIKVDPDSPTDLITVEGVAWLLSELRGHADWLVVDSPPNLPVPDALIIGRQVESVLLVVRAGQTPRETVRRGIVLQQQFCDNVMGILMNNCAEVLPYYYHHRHYGYGYGNRG
jgi:polysaccharide biosynthesis transport protein